MTFQANRPGTTAQRLWYVRVNDAVYGPFDDRTLWSYVQEGRVTAQSELSLRPDMSYQIAQNWLEIAHWFHASPAKPRPVEPTPQTVQTVPEPHLHAQAQGQAPTQARPQVQAPVYEPKAYQPAISDHHAPSHTFDTRPVHEPLAQTPTASYMTPQQAEPQLASLAVIMAEIRSGQSMAFLQTMQSLGDAQRIGDAVWLLRSNAMPSQLKAILGPTLSVTDRLFITDATRSDHAAHNLGPAVEAQLSDMFG